MPAEPASPPLDRPGHVRAGEELDTAALERYLHQVLPGASGPLAVRQFPGGYSNLTYLLTLDDRALVLRRPPFGANIKSAHDMGREYRVLTGLARTEVKAPQPIHYCDDADVIGAPFYIMERLSGVILRPGQAATVHDRTSTQQMWTLSNRLIDNLAAIHAVNLHTAGLNDLGRPDGYVTRQIDGWTRRYAQAQTDDLPDLAAAANWLHQNRPAHTAGTLIHNDYKFDNVLFDPDLNEIVGILDWEMCTLGDPLMDLGTTLGYWIEPEDPAPVVAMFGLTARPGLPRRMDIVERYASTSGRTVDSLLFYYVYGVFKIAVIVQQIYARYRRGHTQDARFAGLNSVVAACGTMAARAIDRDGISHG